MNGCDWHLSTLLNDSAAVRSQHVDGVPYRPSAEPISRPCAFYGVAITPFDRALPRHAPRQDPGETAAGPQMLAMTGWPASSP